MVASVDGWNEKEGAIEIKVPNQKDHDLAVKGEIPVHYIPQCQGIMLITDTDEMWYVSYDAQRKHTAEVLIKRDLEWCKKIEDAAEKFYDHIVSLTPPETKEEYPHFFDEQGLEPEFRKAKEQMDYWKDQYDILKEKAIAQVGGRNAYLGNLRITKSTKPGNVEYKNIPELKSVNLDLYRKKPITSWLIS